MRYEYHKKCQKTQKTDFLAIVLLEKLRYLENTIIFFLTTCVEIRQTLVSTTYTYKLVKSAIID
jgi:hypothetical protein